MRSPPRHDPRRPPAAARLDDLRLLAAVAETRSFTAAAHALGLPKQTVSRRIAALEARLGVALLHRTTRRIVPTDAGARLAARADEIVRLADDAERELLDTDEAPRGTLRITADPVLGESFVGDVVHATLRRHPALRIEVLLTRRKVDLVEEGFDVAFRVGAVEDESLVAIRLGPARVRLCASPAYVKDHGTPARVEDLRAHALVASADAGPVVWPLRRTRPDGASGLSLVPISPRLTTSSLAMALAAVRDGLGIGLFPELACAEDVRRGRLVSLLDAHVGEVGAIWLVHPSRRTLPRRARLFIDLVRSHLDRAPWQPGRR